MSSNKKFEINTKQLSKLAEIGMTEQHEQALHDQLERILGILDKLFEAPVPEGQKPWKQSIVPYSKARKDEATSYDKPEIRDIIVDRMVKKGV